MKFNNFVSVAFKTQVFTWLLISYFGGHSFYIYDVHKNNSKFWLKFCPIHKNLTPLVLWWNPLLLWKTMFWNFNKKINIAIYTVTFFFAEAHSIYKSIEFNKTGRKISLKSTFVKCYTMSWLLCFQGNIATVKSNNVKDFTCVENKEIWFLDRWTSRRSQKYPRLSAKSIPNHLQITQNFVTLFPQTLVLDVINEWSLKYNKTKVFLKYLLYIYISSCQNIEKMREKTLGQKTKTLGQKLFLLLNELLY